MMKIKAWDYFARREAIDKVKDYLKKNRLVIVDSFGVWGGRTPALKAQLENIMVYLELHEGGEIDYKIKARTAKGGYKKGKTGTTKSLTNIVNIAKKELEKHGAPAEEISQISLKDFQTNSGSGGVSMGGIKSARVVGIIRIINKNLIQRLDVHDVHDPTKFERGSLFLVDIITLKGAYRMLVTDGEKWFGVSHKGMEKLSDSYRIVEELAKMNQNDKHLINLAIETFFE
jgi:hypothetical protein